MKNGLPESVTYVVIGGGVHGLSTAWHLAMELKAKGKGSGRDILLLDKAQPGAGATGIACGCVRNFYMTEPIHAILRHSVDVWNYDPVAFGFQQVGYISCGEANQIADYERIHKSQNSGERYGVSIYSGVEVEGYEITNGQVSAVRTNRGSVRCEVAVLGLGAWMPHHWKMLQKPLKIDVGYRDGSEVKDKDMWTYWRLEEGEIYYDGPYYTQDNRNPPVLHIELMNTPVNDPVEDKELKDNVYVYWKNGTERMERPGIQGGAIPVMIGPDASVEPYGHANDAYQAGEDFADYITACMGMFMTRFEDIRPDFKQRRNGGIGAFTPDNVPIVDWILPNVFMIADSNHGFKMTGLGSAVEELKPFAFSRYERGQAFGSGTTHCPWV